MQHDTQPICVKQHAHWACIDIIGGLFPPQKSKTQ